MTIGAQPDTRPHLPHTDLGHVTPSSTLQGLVLVIKSVLNVKYASNWIIHLWYKKNKKKKKLRITQRTKSNKSK